MRFQQSNQRHFTTAIIILFTIISFVCGQDRLNDGSAMPPTLSSPVEVTTISRPAENSTLVISAGGTFNLTDNNNSNTTIEVLTPLLKPSQRLNLAWLGSLEGGANTLLQGHPGLFGFLMAVNEANADERYSAAPIDFQYFSSDSSPARTTAATFDMIQNGATAIIGEYLSSISSVAQYVAQYFKVPQISPSSTSLDFTIYHQSTYPYFLRNVPHVGLQAAQMAQMIKSLGWTRVGVIYTSDVFGASGANEFSKNAKEIGIQVAVAASFNIGDTDVSFQIRRLVDADVKIIVYWGVNGDLRTLWYACANPAVSEVNLLGDGYQWILNHGVATPQHVLDANGTVDPNMVAWSEGQIGLQYQIETDTQVYQDFVQRYRATPYSNLTSSVHPEDNTVAVGLYTLFTYDAAWQMIRAMRSMIYDLGLDPTLEENRAIFYQVCVNTTFEGVTGPVQLDSIGDRNAPFAIVNFQREVNKFVPIGHMSPDGSIVLDEGAQFQYAGIDGSVKPLDHTPRGLEVTSLTMRRFVIGFSICVLGLLLFGQIFVFLLREQPAFKSASPRFLILYLLGVQLLCASVIPRALESWASIGSNWPCAADLWMTNMGYTLLIAAILLKSYRLQTIFNRKKFHSISSVKETKMLLMLGFILALEAGLLLGLHFGAPTQIQLKQFDDRSDYHVCYNRQDNLGDAEDSVIINIHLPVTISTRFALLILTMVCVYSVRNTPNLYNESKQLGLTIYNLFFLSILLPIIDAAVGRSSGIAVLAYAICVFGICVLSVGIIFVPKFAFFVQRSTLSSFSGEKGKLGFMQRGSSQNTGTSQYRGSNISLNPTGIVPGNVVQFPPINRDGKRTPTTSPRTSPVNVPRSPHTPRNPMDRASSPIQEDNYRNLLMLPTAPATSHDDVSSMLHDIIVTPPQNSNSPISMKSGMPQVLEYFPHLQTAQPVQASIDTSPSLGSINFHHQSRSASPSSTTDISKLSPVELQRQFTESPRSSAVNSRDTPRLKVHVHTSMAHQLARFLIHEVEMQQQQASNVVATENHDSPASTISVPVENIFENPPPDELLAESQQFPSYNLRSRESLSHSIIELPETEHEVP